MRNSCGTLVFYFVLVMCLQSVAQQVERPRIDPAIDFGNVRLGLRMSKDKVMPLLTERYEVSPVKSSPLPVLAGREVWDVTEKTEPHFLVGNIAFERNVLVSASRLWVASDTAFSAAHTMAKLLARFKVEGFVTCIASTDKEFHAENEFEREVLMFDCGSKGIVVYADRIKYLGQSFEGVMIVETMQTRSSQK